MIRALVAALGVLLGWSLQMAIYLAIAQPSAHDLRVWNIYTGAYSFAGWLLVGLPVVLRNPQRLLRRPLKAVLMSGLAGAGLTLIPPAIALFPIAAPLAFLVAAIAMWTYIAALTFWPNLAGD